MATIKQFEDLLCWKKSRILTREIYKTFRDCRDRGLRDQIQRASVSVMSNIAEGFERGTRQELVNYLYIAKGSAGEVRSQLYIALDVGYINVDFFKSLSGLASECSKLIQSFAGKAKQGPHRGLQFKQPERADFLKEMTKEKSPELYERFYGDK